MFDELMIHSKELHRGKTDANVLFDARLPWYRGLPLSCVERVEITLDGEVIPEENTFITVSGVQHRVTDLPELMNATWFVLDLARVEADSGKPLAPGPHDVSLGIKLRIPYGEPDYYEFDFNQYAFCKKTLELVGRDW
jgi:hypothetical protein